MPLIPFVRRFFQDMQRREIWRTRADWFSAYQAFAELEGMLMAGCMQQLIDEQQRLYRLWDTALNGTAYTVAGDGISPELPAVPPATATAAGALRAQVARLRVLAENTAVGTTAPAGAGLDGAAALADDTTARQLLRRLTVGIDGNGTPAPGDSLLEALRGQVEAGADRNVIDKIAQLDTLLAEIRNLLQ
jgi:hypothetical protein